MCNAPDLTSLKGSKTLVFYFLKNKIQKRVPQRLVPNPHLASTVIAIGVLHPDYNIPPTQAFILSLIKIQAPKNVSCMALIFLFKTYTLIKIYI